ncbi:hypothetical protein ACIU1J_01855 [Azospirillum doebereinerae]|uniref:hypothetical protein n=1 Tax=Azospirillum doebereinerae TaxID=92933 RepID=UPI001EE60945|nr:hypothetical protein [Azospirillum doebereinerae]MCG5240076.1 hypothetical protein [Azospirillum doebereinerae]
MNEMDARVLAFRFMCVTEHRAAHVYRMCRRVLGHREARRESRAVWSDAYELLVVLTIDSETFAASLRRRVIAAERGSAMTEYKRGVAA